MTEEEKSLRSTLLKLQNDQDLLLVAIEVIERLGWDAFTRLDWHDIRHLKTCDITYSKCCRPVCMALREWAKLHAKQSTQEAEYWSLFGLRIPFRPRYPRDRR